MNSILVYLTLGQLVGLNLWHFYLTVFKNVDHRANSISEIATSTGKTLLAHKLLHFIGAFFLISFAVGYLIPNDMVVVGVLLLTGAVADILQAITLDRLNSFHPLKPEAHQIFAWVMQACYVLYTALIGQEVGLNWAVYAVTVAVVCASAATFLTKFHRFWIIQNLSFIFLAIIIFISHIRLL